MRPPSHPVVTSGEGAGLLYEPGDHTLLFAMPWRSPAREHGVRVLRLPWLFVGERYRDGDYRSCEALFFFADPRPSERVPAFVRVSTVLGNGVGHGRLCLGHASDVPEDADLWNTTFERDSWAAFWTMRVDLADGDPCRALLSWDYEGHTLVHAWEKSP